MHELGIAVEVLDAAVAEAKRHGASKVVGLTLRVGVLRGVVPESLSFLFGHVAKGTIAEGARMEIEEEPIRVVCRACGPSEGMEFTLECPACGRPWNAVEGGDSLRIVSIEIDTDPAT